MISTAGGHEQRCCKATQRTHHRQRWCILQYGQRSGKSRHHNHQCEHRPHRKHTVETKGRKQSEVQHRHRAALQHLRIAGTVVPQPPAQPQQHQRYTADGSKPHLNRHMHMFTGELGQESQANEQNAYPNFNDGVATEQPALERRKWICTR